MITLYATGRFPFRTLDVKPGDPYQVATDWTAQSHLECGWACLSRAEALAVAEGDRLAALGPTPEPAPAPTPKRPRKSR